MMTSSATVLLVGWATAAAAAIHSPTSLQPVGRADSTWSANGSLATVFGSNGTVTIKGSTTAAGVVVLDYGFNVEGYPTFQVVSATGDTSKLEITYSETKAVLDGFYMVKYPIQVPETPPDSLK